MLNEIHVEGVIAARWRYSDAEFLRVAVYADPGRGARRADGNGREAADYVTLRCEGLTALAVAGLREGDRLRATGQLTSREYDVSLAAFLKKARGDGKAQEALRSLAAEYGDDLAMPNVINEVLVERLTALQRNEREPSGPKPARERRQRSQTPPATQAEPVSEASSAG